MIGRDDRGPTVTEEARWILTLGVPFAVAAVCLMAVFATGISWLIAGAILAGPGAGVMGLVLLAINSDTNATAAVPNRKAASSSKDSVVVLQAA